jgi:cytochrome c peroxidase
VIPIWVTLFTGCKKEMNQIQIIPYQEVPEGFPDMVFPEGNEFSRARWELGKKLFFDPVLSRDSSVSCSTCHLPHLAFADNRATTPGIENRPGVRNSPSLANVGYFPYLLREGGVPTLEMQVLVPISEHNEFDYNIVDLAYKLRKNPDYVNQAMEAYEREVDPFVITRAIANFERSLISGNSRFDKFLNGNTNALSTQEKAGMELFMSERLNCSSCHHGVFLTDHSFQNNGLYIQYPDSGKIRLTGLESDRALFKVPSLRNVGLTAPYMHNGELVSLMDVVNHYNSGGVNHANKSALIKPLGLTIAEKDALIEFLHSLSDFDFVNDPKWN